MLIDSLSLMEIWSFSRARNVWVKPWIECFKFYFIKDFQLTLSSKESSTDISSFCCETCTLNAFKWSWLLPRYDWISGALEWWLTDCGTSELGFWYVSLGTLEIISRVASAIFLKPYIIFCTESDWVSPTLVTNTYCRQYLLLTQEILRLLYRLVFPSAFAWPILEYDLKLVSAFVSFLFSKGYIFDQFKNNFPFQNFLLWIIIYDSSSWNQSIIGNA